VQTPQVSPDAQPLDTDEAVRRIQERDHVLRPGVQPLPYEAEQVLVEALREGRMLAFLLLDGQLAFTWAPGQSPHRLPDA